MNKSIKVFVNAGDKVVSFARCDREEWSKPLFVNVPGGVRQAIVTKLRKDDAGKATRNITWELPTEMISTQEIKSGPNTGSEVFVVKIAEEFLSEWLTQLVVTDRGAATPVVAAALATWLADDDNEVIPTADPFGKG